MVLEVYKRGAILRNLPDFSSDEISLEILESDDANIISLVMSTLLAIQIL